MAEYIWSAPFEYANDVSDLKIGHMIITKLEFLCLQRFGVLPQCFAETNFTVYDVPHIKLLMEDAHGSWNLVTAATVKNI